MALRLTKSADALRDIRHGWQHREGWWALSRQSLRASYRRTTLGPFWITIQQAAFIVGISVLYSQLFKVRSTEFIPLVALGISFWGFLTNCVTAASTIYARNAQAIISSTFPISFYIFLTISQQLLTFLHSAIALIPITFMLGASPRLACLITVPLAICIATINGLAIGLWLGPLSARYRDISAAIPVLLQLAFFLSPVFWSPTLLNDREWIVRYNPIAWMIETFRSPILGASVNLDDWFRLAIFTIANLALGVAVLSHVHNRISYWI